MSTVKFQIYKDQLMKFGETVSVKGVSRIVKSDSKILRAQWLIAVVTFLCILLWQLSTNFMTYFSWPVDTVSEESPDPPLFPDVTFCNTYPVRAFEKMSEKMSMKTYLNLSYESATALGSNEEFWSDKNFTALDILKMRLYFSSNTAYISSFPISDNNFTFDDGLFYSRESYKWHWNSAEPKCQVASIQRRWDPNYSSCSTIRVTDECQRRIRGVAFILFLDNFPEVVQLAYRSGLIVSKATGVLFAIHAPGTEPNLRTAHSIGPGTETGIRLSPTIRSRLPSPYGDCTSQTYIEDEEDDPNVEKLLYTKDLCFDICFQQQTVYSCGCLSTSFPFTPQQKLKTNGIVCGNLSLLENATPSLILKGFNDYICTVQAHLDLNQCEQKCKSQCHEMTYDMTVTTAPWPHVTSQLAFAGTFDNNPLTKSRSEFDIYDTITNQFLTDQNDTETIRLLESLDLIEKNFLQVNIFYDSYTSVVLKDVPSMTSDKLMGLIGGVLSLWLGITIMTLVEVVEFLLSLIEIYISKKRVNTQSDATGC